METSKLASLQAQAAPGVWARGEAYARQGAVLRLLREGEWLGGWVQGTRRYQPAWLPGGAWACDCPYEGPGPCKHVVALAVAWAAGMAVEKGEEPGEEACWERAWQAAPVAIRERFLQQWFAKDVGARRAFARFIRPEGRRLLREAIGQAKQRAVPALAEGLAAYLAAADLLHGWVLLLALFEQGSTEAVAAFTEAEVAWRAQLQRQVIGSGEARQLINLLLGRWSRAEAAGEAYALEAFLPALRLLAQDPPVRQFLAQKLLGYGLSGAAWEEVMG